MWNSTTIRYWAGFLFGMGGWVVVVQLFCMPFALYMKFPLVPPKDLFKDDPTMSQDQNRARYDALPQDTKLKIEETIKKNRAGRINAMRYYCMITYFALLATLFALGGVTKSDNDNGASVLFFTSACIFTVGLIFAYPQGIIEKNAETVDSKTGVAEKRKKQYVALNPLAYNITPMFFIVTGYYFSAIRTNIGDEEINRMYYVDFNRSALQIRTLQEINTNSYSGLFVSFLIFVFSLVVMLFGFANKSGLELKDHAVYKWVILALESLGASVIMYVGADLYLAYVYTFSSGELVFNESQFHTQQLALLSIPMITVVLVVINVWWGTTVAFYWQKIDDAIGLSDSTKKKEDIEEREPLRGSSGSTRFPSGYGFRN